MNHWFGMLHVPRDGWCHWCIEDARSFAREAGSDGRSGWTWEAGWHCWLHTEHFTQSPDVTGHGTGITRHPAPHNGNNCVMGWQFTAPFDSSNACYSSGVTASLSAQQGQSNKGHDCVKTLDVDDAWLSFLQNVHLPFITVYICKCMDRWRWTAVNAYWANCFSLPQLFISFFSLQHVIQ